MALAFWIMPKAFRLYKYTSAYNQVSIKDARDLVVARFGIPERIAECGACPPDLYSPCGSYSGNISWDGENTRENSGECKTEIWYFSPLPYVAPTIWSIGFDKNDRAISKYAYQSP